MAQAPGTLGSAGIQHRSERQTEQRRAALFSPLCPVRVPNMGILQRTPTAPVNDTREKGPEPPWGKEDRLTAAAPSDRKLTG